MNENIVNQYRILIVDDNTRNIQVLGSIMDREDCDIYFAENGKDALALAEQESFDLFLLDITLPDIDGYEICRRLKENPETSDVPVIYITARNDEEDIVRAFESGAVDYVTKPFRRNELLARVMTHLKLKDREKELLQLNAAKDRFYSIISHDLRSPLSSIVSIFEMLHERADKIEEKEIKELISSGGKASERLKGLLENLLVWTESQRGTIEFQPENMNIWEVAKESAELLLQMAQNKGVKIINGIPSDIMVNADKNQIRTVLRNLISNALKFTQTEGVVSVSAKRIQDLIEVSVTDTGRGIDAEYIPRLFRIDQKYKTKGTQGETGSGLGLLLCRDFVEMNRGQIRVESTPGKGSCFIFTLPAGN